MNGYGQAFMDGGKNSAAFGLIATVDSDNDGFTNGQEAAAKANIELVSWRGRRHVLEEMAKSARAQRVRANPPSGIIHRGE